MFYLSWKRKEKLSVKIKKQPEIHSNIKLRILGELDMIFISQFLKRLIHGTRSAPLWVFLLYSTVSSFSFRIKKVILETKTKNSMSEILKMQLFIESPMPGSVNQNQRGRTRYIAEKNENFTDLSRPLVMLWVSTRLFRLMKTLSRPQQPWRCFLN